MPRESELLVPDSLPTDAELLPDALLTTDVSVPSELPEPANSLLSDSVDLELTKLESLPTDADSMPEEWPTSKESVPSELPELEHLKPDMPTLPA